MLDCLALRIREIGLLTRRFHDDALITSCFDTFAVESDVCLARENPSRAGSGVGLPRIAYSRNWALDSAISRRQLEDSLFLHIRCGE